jgi:hypothetical protein
MESWIASDCEADGAPRIFRGSAEAFAQARVAYEARALPLAACWFQVAANSLVTDMLPTVADVSQRANVYLGILYVFGLGVEKNPVSSFLKDGTRLNYVEIGYSPELPSYGFFFAPGNDRTAQEVLQSWATKRRQYRGSEWTPWMPGGSITKVIGGVPVFLFRECSSNRLYMFTWLNNARSLSEVPRRGCPREHGEGSRWRGAPCRSGYGFSIAYWGRIGRGSMLGHVASRDRICRPKAVWVRNGEGNRVRVMIIRVCEHTKDDSLIRRITSCQ